MHQLLVALRAGCSAVLMFVRFEVLTDVTMKGTFFWDVMLCSLADVSEEHSASVIRSKSNPSRQINYNFCLLFIALAYYSTLKMDVVHFLRKVSKFLPDYTA